MVGRLLARTGRERGRAEHATTAFYGRSHPEVRPMCTAEAAPGADALAAASDVALVIPPPAGPSARGALPSPSRALPSPARRKRCLGRAPRWTTSTRPSATRRPAIPTARDNAPAVYLDGRGLRRGADRPRRDPGQAHRRERLRLRGLDFAAAHHGDGYGTSSSWLAAQAGLSKKAAKAAVRQMRQLRDRPLLDGALAAGDITDSLAFEIAGGDLEVSRCYVGGNRPHPPAGRTPPGRLSMTWPLSRPARSRTGAQQYPHPDNPDDGFDDRFVGAGHHVRRRGHHPRQPDARMRHGARCSPGGPRQEGLPGTDDRTEGKRFHDDVLQLACELLLRARLVPDRAGADTQAVIHIPLSQLRAMPGSDGPGRRLDPRPASAKTATSPAPAPQGAACDAQTVPVVTGTMNPDVIDQIIDLARAAAEADGSGAEEAGTTDPGSAARQDLDSAAAGSPGKRNRWASGRHASRCRPGQSKPASGKRLRFAIARLAVDLVPVPLALPRSLDSASWTNPGTPRASPST